MDLLQTVRKEGSRGGRANFTWDDVRNDTQRENYLGHSLMAPVGRWQKNKDLQWYSRNKDGDDNRSEAEKRKEEIRKVKQQEEDAMARALGYDVPVRAENGDATGANAAPVGNREDVERALNESAAERGEGEEAAGKGLGFGGGGGKSFDNEDRIEGTRGKRHEQNIGRRRARIGRASAVTGGIVTGTQNVMEVEREGTDVIDTGRVVGRDLHQHASAGETTAGQDLRREETAEETTADQDRQR